jgi:PAS domain S-box-containing protein
MDHLQKRVHCITLFSVSTITIPDHGSWFYGEIAAKALKVNGEPGVQVWVKDITKEKLAREALAKSEATMQGILEAAPIGICVMRDRRYLRANRYLCEAFGYPEKSILGKTTRMLYESDEEYERVGKELYYDIAKKGIASTETRLKRSDGVFRHCLITAAPIYRDNPNEGAVVIVQDITESKLAEEALRESEERFRHTFYTSPDAITLGRLREAVFVDVNEGFTKLTGYERDEVIGRTAFELNIWADPKDREKMVAELTQKGFCDNMEALFRRKDGSLGVGLLSGKIINLGGIPHTIAVTRDISEIKRVEEERKRLEAQLLQAQKMESVGRLAGGVAHDFNNMLGVILGRAELALASLSPTDPIRKDILDIQSAAKRSAELTRQLLAFARRQTAEPRVLDINDTIQGMLGMLRRLIGEDIELAWIPGDGVWPVRIDPAQVDQILANLVVNARDAISDVGRITIESENCILGEQYCHDRPYVAPGRYVLITVTDSGCGMTKDVMDRIFEPFFTTKEVGKGTGLGLATVYGIVKQNEGYINVYSEVGRGTSFKIYLPAYLEKAYDTPNAREDIGPSGGQETILLVEDEPMLLDIERNMLERLGYKVLTALGPVKALEILNCHEAQIDLLITDVVMPEMNGRDLWEKASALRPSMKCLFTSGYTANVVARHGVLKEGVNFIQKPMTISELDKKIRKALS